MNIDRLQIVRSNFYYIARLQQPPLLYFIFYDIFPKEIFEKNKLPLPLLIIFIYIRYFLFSFEETEAIIQLIKLDKIRKFPSLLYKTYTFGVPFRLQKKNIFVESPNSPLLQPSMLRPFHNTFCIHVHSCTMSKGCPPRSKVPPLDRVLVLLLR